MGHQEGRLRTLYLLTLTQALSLLGSRMAAVAVGLWVYARTGQATPLLLAAFFAELPVLALGGLAGILADRVDRRWVLVLGDAGQALGTVALLASVLAGEFRLWHLYAASGLQGLFVAVQAPAASAVVGSLAPPARRDRMNGLREMSYPLAGTAAPALAGLLYGVLGLPGVLAVDLATFVVAVGVVSALAIPQPEPSREGASPGAVRRDLLSGLRHLRDRRGLLELTLGIGLVYWLINGPLDLAIPYLTRLVHDERTVGLLLAAMNLGALAGGAAVAMAPRIRRRVPLILLGFALHGAMFVFLGLSRGEAALASPGVLGAVLFALMLPLAAIGALYSTVVQGTTPPDLQGRVFAAAGQWFVLGTPLSFLLTGLLVDRVLEPAASGDAWRWVAPVVGREAGAGMALLLVVVGLLILVATAALALQPAVRRLEEG